MVLPDFKKLFGFVAVCVTVLAVPLLTRKAEQSLAALPPQTMSNDDGELPAPSDAPSFVCKDMLEVDGNELALKLSTETKVVDCFTVGCGSLF